MVENGSDIEQRITEVGVDLAAANTMFSYDTSDEISASYVIDRCSNAVPGSLIVIDYLQILDQQRDKPVLAEQVDALHSFTRGQVNHQEVSYGRHTRRATFKTELRLQLLEEWLGKPDFDSSRHECSVSSNPRSSAIRRLFAFTRSLKSGSSVWRG